jgi:hypothetical protein
VMTIGLVYLLLVDCDRLVECYFRAQTGLQSVTSVRMSTKNIAT